MLPEPALLDRIGQVGPVFGRLASAPQKRKVDLLNMDASVLYGLHGDAAWCEATGSPDSINYSALDQA
jgi:hypothetical protein